MPEDADRDPGGRRNKREVDAVVCRREKVAPGVLPSVSQARARELELVPAAKLVPLAELQEMPESDLVVGQEQRDDGAEREGRRHGAPPCARRRGAVFAQP